MYNRKAASVCLVVAAVFSLLFGTLRSVASLASGVAALYSEGSAKYGSVKDDMNMILSHSEQLFAVYTAIFSSDEISSSFSDALTDLKNCIGDPMDKKFPDAVANLKNCASNAYYKIEITKEIENSQEYLSAAAYYREIQSSFMRIENNTEYSSAVKKYNNAISSFQGSLAARILSLNNASPAN